MCDYFNMGAMKQTRCPELTKYPAWTAEERPKSKGQPLLGCCLPLSGLHKALISLKDDPGLTHCDIAIGEPSQTFQGHALSLAVQLRHASIPIGYRNYTKQSLALGVYISRKDWV